MFKLKDKISFKKKIFKNRGFTLIELVVSIGIFALMTGILLSKYGNFNNSVILTNLAYDVAITIRTAQSYGIDVKGVENPNNANQVEFNNAYGVYFDRSSLDKSKQMIFYVDFNGNNKYTSGLGEEINTYALKRGMYISSLCAGSSSADCTTNRTKLNIAFKRPDPKAIISNDDNCPTDCGYARIELTSNDGSKKYVEVRSTGQISVKDN
jgi:prepilin-type N-terminal cleavage/methylation domain-containing protein